MGAVIGLAFGSILLLVGLSRAAIVWAKGEPVTFRDSLVPAHPVHAEPRAWRRSCRPSLRLGDKPGQGDRTLVHGRRRGTPAIMAVDGTLPWQFGALDWGFVLGCGAVFGCAVGLGLEQLSCGLTSA